MDIYYAGQVKEGFVQGIVGNLALIYLEPVGIVRVETARLMGEGDGVKITGRQTSEEENREEGCGL